MRLPPSRIHERADSTTQNTVRYDRSVDLCYYLFGWAASSRGHRYKKYRTDHFARARWVGGTLIHNGKFGPPEAVGSLTIPLILPPFLTPAVTKVSGAPLFPACFFPTTVAAILLPTIAGGTDPEDRPALCPSAKSLT